MVKFNKPIKNVLNYPNEVWKRIEEQNAYIYLIMVELKVLLLIIC